MHPKRDQSEVNKQVDRRGGRAVHGHCLFATSITTTTTANANRHQITISPHLAKTNSENESSVEGQPMYNSSIFRLCLPS